MDNSTNGMNETLVLYLDDELSQREREEVENRLATDTGLQNELLQLKLAREAIRFYGLRQKVSVVHTEMMETMQAPLVSTRGPRRIIRYSLSIAAGLLLLFAGIAGYNFYRLSPDKIFNESFQSYELSTVRGENANNRVENLYREKRYQDVVSATLASADVHEIFLAAMSDMEIKNYSAAAEAYKKVISWNESRHSDILKEESEYYLALAYIIQKKYHNALPILQMIKNNSSHLYNGKVSAKMIRQVKLLLWK